MSSARDLPDAIRWHEGMLLTPQHFQELGRRFESLVHYRSQLDTPYSWGVRHLDIDRVLLVDGKLRVRELEAVMPDGLVVSHRASEDGELAADLTALAAGTPGGRLRIHLAVAATEGETEEDLARHASFEGRPVRGGDGMDVRIPRLRPRLHLLVTDRPSPRYTSFPLAEVALRDDGYELTEFVPPTLRISARSRLGRLCSRVAQRLRRKAAACAEKARSPVAAAGDTEMGDLRAMARSLGAPLPPFEALLASGVAHPFQLYLALTQVVGEVAAFSRTLVPPPLNPYDHDDLWTTYREAVDFVLETLKPSLFESHMGYAFVLRDGVFRLGFEERWLAPGRDLVLAVQAGREMVEKDVIAWIREARIGSATVIDGMRDRRVLGARRRLIDRLGPLVPGRGVVFFRMEADPVSVRAQEDLEIWPARSTSEGHMPAKIVLYVSREGEDDGADAAGLAAPAEEESPYRGLDETDLGIGPARPDRDEDGVPEGER